MCGRWDSNPHAFRHRNLNPACLPVSPLPRSRQSTKGGVVTTVAGHYGVRMGLFGPSFSKVWDQGTPSPGTIVGIRRSQVSEDESTVDLEDYAVEVGGEVLGIRQRLSPLQDVRLGMPVTVHRDGKAAVIRWGAPVDRRWKSVKPPAPGIEDKVDVSPLFETESALEHGGRGPAAEHFALGDERHRRTRTYEGIRGGRLARCCARPAGGAAVRPGRGEDEGVTTSRRSKD